MNKKQYRKPEIKVRAIEESSSLMAASGTEMTIEMYTNETLDNDQALSKPSFNVWGDDEEEL